MKSIETYIFKNSSKLYEIKNKMIDSFVNNEFEKSDNFKIFINETEVTSYTYEDNFLVFDYFIDEGSYIEIHDNISLDFNKYITKNSYDKKSIFKVFSKNQKLKYNHKYTLSCDILGVDNIKNYNYTVNAIHDPFYCSVEQIRFDCNDFIDEISDEQISKAIYLNSKIAKELLEAKDEGNSSNTTNKIPRYVKSFVRYKTDIDICTAIYLSISGKFGTINKQIGSIHITKDIKLPYLKDIMKRFEENLKGPSDQLNGRKAKSSSFVKATNNFPFPGNKRFF